MRRKDREIVDKNIIHHIIQNCHCCRLGFCDKDTVYIVPLHFGYEETEDGKRVFYFHGALEGRKIDLIRQTHHAGFELDTNYVLHENERACGYSAGFQSVIGTGQIQIVADRQKKLHALQVLMLHNTGKKEWDIPDAALDQVAVMELVVESLSCKEHF